MKILKLIWFRCFTLLGQTCHTPVHTMYDGGGDAQNVDVELGHFLDVDCRLQGFKKCRIYKEFL